MARKLSLQQHRRVQQIQQQHQTEPSTDTQIGLLITRHGRNAVVENAEGELITCHLRQHLSDIVAGDKVVWQKDASDSGVILTHTERHTALNKSVDGKGRALAANVTCMVIVFAGTPAPSPRLIDKYLLAAELMGITPLLVHNKCDISICADLLDIYHKIGYKLMLVSAHTGKHFEALRCFLQTQTSVMVGQSGVGKSSLIARLIPKATVRVQAISTQAELGRHTTSGAYLYHIPGGGDMIDSPGVRDIALGNLSSMQVRQGFKELRQLGPCKFRNCQHHHEPDCAVLKALNDGAFAPSRYESLIEFDNRE